MMASGISASGLSDYANQSSLQQLLQEFQQLGKDLQAGNLTAAQSDFVTLQQDLPQSSVASASQTGTASASSSQTSNQSSDPIAQTFAQLASDLQSGNLTAAQQDYSTLKQDFQSAAAQGSQGTELHSHHHHHSGSSSSDSSGSGAIGQLLNELGQDLKTGNLSAAQQTYQSLQQDMKQFSSGSSTQTQPSSASSSSSVSVTA
jgi:outer membrane protein assembly factor BamD (BamD/ComL family)